MKKVTVLIAALIPALGAFAYNDGYSHSTGGFAGFITFFLIAVIAYIILSVVVLVRWWNMTAHVKEIKNHLDAVPSDNPKLTYLIAIGETAQADKAALTMLVDRLMPIYFDKNNMTKAKSMDAVLSTLLPKIERLDIQLPDYVKSGADFIGYMNKLTGNKVN